ncbi:putative carbohydrate-binding protein with CBM5 and CBM33 domain [Acinetobacter calcoaceticus]|uniref:Putative carbohydrate-binding protein with CBM5 and CBM33 domain n=1 Tax=Acinetobacter calcoaceticus TaxID=471 RepID=A0A4R1XWE2_ACICA|nr:putative carbohydrate-binding protein with CBM5 and CBM33 domain [Acinetobacter calcoaceticus]
MKHEVLIKCGSLIAVLTSSIISTNLFAHGYVLKPESRSYACKLNKNSQCGSIVWEAQSLEGGKNFPQAGPTDGKLASASLSQFAELDQQSPTRWSKSNISTGPIDFTWLKTAAHATQSWRYFITKPGWNQSAALTRNSFDLKPFCEVDGQNRQPAIQLTHRCTIPADRSGYHVILAVWDIADTVNAFYNAIDVQIGAGPAIPSPPPPPPPTPPVAAASDWIEIGDITPIDDLKPKDQVKTRVFDANGENPKLQTVITIQSKQEGDRNLWPRLLAEAINAQHKTLIAGIKNSKGEIVPVQGKNNVYTRGNSGLKRVEFKIERAANNTPPIVTPPTPPQPTPTPPTQPPSTGTNGKYQYVYPENITSYKAGTRVLGSDGQVYECKPFPYSGWCTIKATQYTPATGSHWQDAWSLVKNP